MNEQQNVELKLIHMEDVVSKEVEWLWYPYIPYGKITIIEGDPGEGKTTLVLMLAAALSRGLPLPCDDDKAYEPIHIIYQTAEDGIDDTVKPRLEKAGADCSMIRVIDETEKELCMTDDRLEKAIVETGARLIILDPIQAYIGAKVDMHRANEIRPVLKHLGMIAEKYNCAVILISNKKSAITSKSKLLGVAKHNLRKYKSDDYSKDNIIVLRGTDDLLQDVKNVYHQEFDEAVKEYNEKQKRADRKIEDYFEHVAGLEQDMAVEIIFQCGDKEFWQAHDDVKDKMYYVYSFLIGKLEELLPEFKIANAVIHFDEASPHVHVVGVPVWEGAKRGLRKKVSKRNVFTPETLSVILQDKLREEAGMCFRYHIHEDLSEKSLGRNHDLSVAEYKVAKETKHLEQIQEQVHDADIELLASQIAYKELERRQTKELNEKTDAIVKKNEAMEQEYTDKKEKLECEISYLESKRNIEKSLSDMDKRESQRISNELEGKRLELQSVNQEIEYTTDKAKEAVVLLDRIKAFVSSFRLFAPTIEEYANQVEADKTIDAGNSFRGILYEIGKLLEAFKELIKEGLCWFPRLMRWNTSKGEVAPVFIEKSSGYSYSVYGYMNVETKEYYSKETVQWEITASNRTGTVEQMDANMEAMVRDLQEILRISAEQKRLWKAYEGR